MRKTSGTLHRFEARLAASARSVAARIADDKAGSGRELEATLLRLGFAFAEVRLLVEGTALPEGGRLAEMAAALERQLAHHTRAARAARPTYDLNRHIAVFRAVRQLAERTGRQSCDAAPGAASRNASAAKSSPIASAVRACMRR